MIWLLWLAGFNWACITLKILAEEEEYRRITWFGVGFLLLFTWPVVGAAITLLALKDWMLEQ